MERKPQTVIPIVAALIGFIVLSYLVKVTNGDVFGACRLVVETSAKLASNAGQSAAKAVTDAAMGTSEMKFQREQELARQRGKHSASGIVNVTVTIEGSSAQGVKATAVRAE
jgi:hypothetical protein